MNKSGLFKCFFSVFIVSFCTRRKSRFFFSALHSGVFRCAEKTSFLFGGCMMYPYLSKIVTKRNTLPSYVFVGHIVLSHATDRSVQHNSQVLFFSSYLYFRSKFKVPRG